MSTPEQPDAPALTRKQMREIRNTGSTPIVTAEALAAAESPAPEKQTEAVVEAEAPVDVAPEPETPIAAPLPRAAEPVSLGDLPGSDSSVDLGVSPLTRRQARQQERIRTASVPVITPDLAAAYSAAPGADNTVSTDAETDVASDTTSQNDAADDIAAIAEQADAPVEVERALVNPKFGADLLAGDVSEVALPPSFDQLISRTVTGSVGTGNALILSEAPSSSPLGAPISATGEILITGTFDLPEGLGSQGHAPGTADGKEVDAVLVDGELPAHSSPTPIAASAAISTVKSTGDIITPPTPEKGGRLMMTLAITAGVLALALVGVLILAFVTGVFS